MGAGREVPHDRRREYASKVIDHGGAVVRCTSERERERESSMDDLAYALWGGWFLVDIVDDAGLCDTALSGNINTVYISV